MVSCIRRTIATAVFLGVMLCSPQADAKRRDSYYPFASTDDRNAKLHVLRGLVRRYGRTGVNRIYVVKLPDPDNPNGSPFLYGYWPEDHSIWLVGNLDPWFEDGRERTDYDWLKYKMRTDLRRDVVPTLKDVGGSSYLVHRSWTRQIIHACLTRGMKLTIYHGAPITSARSQQVVGRERTGQGISN